MGLRKECCLSVCTRILCKIVTQSATRRGILNRNWSCFCLAFFNVGRHCTFSETPGCALKPANHEGQASASPHRWRGPSTTIRWRRRGLGLYTTAGTKAGALLHRSATLGSVWVHWSNSYLLLFLCQRHENLPYCPNKHDGLIASDQIVTRGICVTALSPINQPPCGMPLT